jgi:hypothetical protein
LGDITDVEVKNCDIYCGEGIIAANVTQLRIHDNIFYGYEDDPQADGYQANSGWGVFFQSSRKVDFSENTIQSYDHANGLYMLHGFVMQVDPGNAMDCYFGNNELSEVSPVIAINGGENFLFENGSYLHLHIESSPTSINDCLLTFSGQSWTPNQFVTEDLPGWSESQRNNSSILLVQSGPNAGCWRRIIANTQDTITIDRPLEVPLDTNTVVSIREAILRCVCYKNNFDNSTLSFPLWNGEDHVALVGIMTWGMSLDMIMDSNTFLCYRYGIYAYGLTAVQNSVHRRLPNIGHLICNNSLFDCYDGIRIGSLLAGGCQSENYTAGRLHFDTIVRDNQISNILTVGMSMVGSNASTLIDWDWARNNVFEGNTVVDAEVAMCLGEYESHTIVRNNSFSRTEAFSGSVGIDMNAGCEEPLVLENLFQGSIEMMMNYLIGEDDLVASWAMDDLAWDGWPLEVKDSVGLNNFHGQPVGNPTLITGVNGTAGFFNGSAIDKQTIKLPYPIELTQFTISAWFRIDGHNSHWNIVPGCGDHHFIYCAKKLGYPDVRGISFFHIGKVIRIIDEDGNSENSMLQWDVTGFLGDNTWHHVAVTYDGTTAKVYGDGELKDSVQVSLGAIKPLDENGDSTPYYIGSMGHDRYYFNGGIDEVKIFARALSSSEVENIYQNP